MAEISLAIFSPGWWFTTVFVALIIGVISAWIAQPLGRGLSRLGGSIGRYFEARNQASLDRHIAAVAKLCDSRRLRSIYVEQAFRARLKAIFFLLAAAVGAVIAVIILTLPFIVPSSLFAAPLIFALFCGLRSFEKLSSAIRLETQVEESRSIIANRG